MNRTERHESPEIERSLDNAYESNFETQPKIDPQVEYWTQQLEFAEQAVRTAHMNLAKLAVRGQS